MKKWAIVVCPTCDGQGDYLVPCVSSGPISVMTKRTEICGTCLGAKQIEAELIRVVNEYLIYSGQPGQGGREPLGHCLSGSQVHVSLCGMWCKRGSTGKRFNPEHPRACKECVRLLPKDVR